MSTQAALKISEQSSSDGQVEVRGDSGTEAAVAASTVDIHNPLNWSGWVKWINILLISAQGTLTPVASTILSVAAPAIATDFHTTSAVLPVLPVAFFVLGLGIGPLFFAPLSEAHGRRWVYVTSFGIFTVFNIGCALARNIATLVILRLLSGIAGSAGPSLGGASVGDLFSKQERGKAQAIYGFGPAIGPVIGGVIAGFILDGTRSWRWLMWVMVIAPAATTLLCVAFLRETYWPVILRRKAAKLQQREGTGKLQASSDDGSRVDRKILANLSRPVNLLFTSPICSLLAVYVALVYAILYLHLLSLVLLFSERPQYGLFTYGWTDGTTGLSFLGVGLGIFLGSIFSATLSNPAYRWMEAYRERRKRQVTVGAHQDEEIGPDGIPECRVLLMQVGMLLIPAGLVIFAWTAARVHWVLPLLGAAIFATGLIISYVAFQTYLVDAFGKFAASALATATILRSMLGCVFSVVGFQLYKRLGYATGTMVLAAACIFMAPFPILLYRFGPTLRRRETEKRAARD